MDNKVQPLGPSARMEDMRKFNGRWKRNLEKGFYDTDEGAVNAVLDTYRNGSLRHLESVLRGRLRTAGEPAFHPY